MYPKQASKTELKEYLEGLGFTGCDHFWDWPKGTLNYSWFDSEDFKSIVGVEADIYPVFDDELKITSNPWALHVRNVYSASWHDVHMLNEVLRGARKRFGGIIHGDYGTNRYAPLWEDNSTPISRGISATYQHVNQELSAVKFSLPKPSIEARPVAPGRIDDFIKLTNSLDPGRVIYNGLVPFAVAMFEYFFSQVFQVLISYDEAALAKRADFSQKVSFSDLVEVGNRAKTVASVIAENYTFQNLNQLNKAYREWLGIDVRNILLKKKRIGRSVKFLENQIAEIIQYRHGIVHHFEIDRSLTREGYIDILEAIEKAMDEFTSFLEKKYQIKIERD